MAEEKDRCAGPGCRKVVHQPDEWAIIDGRLICSKECYLRYIKRNHPKVYEQQSFVLGVVD